jgi:5-methylcytosine-specific restriction endonuclease McrA
MNKEETIMSSRTLVLTPWYFPCKIVGWQEAITLVYLQKVDVVVCYDEVIRSPSTAIQLPAVLRMKREVERIKRRVKFSRVNVYRRDGFACAYCAAKLQISELTYDHVVPRAQGGRTAWENILTACVPCNLKKGNRTPAQAGIRPLVKPYRPTSLPIPPPFIDVGTAPPEWRDYAMMLPAAGIV